jgi:ATP phosphoribosyltransferase
MVATKLENAENAYPLNLRVATKYPNIARKFFLQKGIACEVIKLYGSVELAPIVGLASHIVDVVTTGNTLKANGLKEIEFIAESTARLIVNKVSYKTKFKQIKKLIDNLREVL